MAKQSLFCKWGFHKRIILGNLKNLRNFMEIHHPDEVKGMKITKGGQMRFSVAHVFYSTLWGCNRCGKLEKTVP